MARQADTTRITAPGHCSRAHTGAPITMLSFIARRLGLLIPTFFGVTLLTFALIRMIPGDPVEVMMGERRVDPVMHAEAMERLGLNKPLYAQYFDYIGQLAQGDLGQSLRTRESVWSEFLTLFPATVELALAALLAGEPGAFVDALRHLILPAIVLGTIPLAVIARMTRSAMLEVLREDYV